MEGVALARPWPSAMWGGSMGAVGERGYLDGVKVRVRLGLGRDRDNINQSITVGN